jgi:hypothetical protein
MDSRFEAKMRRILNVKSGVGSGGTRSVGDLWVTYTLLTNRHSRPRAICQTRVRASDGERHERLRRVPREHQGLSR